jgi:zinc protease
LAGLTPAPVFRAPFAQLFGAATPEGLSYGVESNLQVSALDKAGTFIASAISAPQNRAKAQKAFQDELTKALADGFSAEELAAAKSGYLQSEEVDRSDDENLSSLLAQHLYDG